MSESAPHRKAFNMNRYRKTLRLAWDTMRRQYADGVPRPELLPEISWTRIGNRPAPERAWPSLEDFEISEARRREE